MTVDYKEVILSTFLDWYENSPAYVRGEKPTRRRIMRLYDGGQTDFPAYNIEDHLIRKDVNQAVLDLAGDDLVGFSWMQGQQNHIIAKVWLNTDAIDRAYARIKRRPKRDVTDELLERLSGLYERMSVEWAKRWLEDTITRVSHKRSVGAALPGDSKERDDLLRAVSSLADTAEIETLERVFSIRCYRDSKHFERTVKKRLSQILRTYLAQDECTDDEALNLVGIVQYPEQFAFSGALSIVFDHGVLDFGVLPFGGTLTIGDLKQGRIVPGPEVQRVLSIENRANYIDYVHKYRGNGELVIYHGGQYSPAKRAFLLALTEALPENCAFYHWGDIDYGGFRMLARLRREILPGIIPWRMDKSELDRYSEYTTGFPDKYKKRLASLLDIPELSDRFSCIEYMIESGVRLEQEAMLTQ